MTVLLYFSGFVIWFLGIIRIVISGNIFILNNFNVVGNMLLVFSFNNGRKFVKSICLNNASIFIMNIPIFNINNNRLDLVITLIPLLVLYIISIINRVHDIMNGVLYNNCDNMKLIMLYRIVIPRTINNRDKIMFIIVPKREPNRFVIF